MTETNESLENKITSWPLKRVGLKVLDLATEIAYYTKLGLRVVRDEQEQGRVGLGVGTGAQARELLSLRLLPGGRPRPARTAGLYHFALLLPSDIELGSFLQYSLNADISLNGASDHLVSQALYLNDPEGNGIEIYADRPRENWPRQEGQIQMATRRLSARALLQQAQPFSSFSDGILLGHMHLNVGNLDRSAAFYKELGMDLMVSIYGQASFLSWEGYHHHLGINTWAGRNVPPAGEDVSGIDFYEIARPDLAATTTTDPDGVNIIVNNGK